MRNLIEPIEDRLDKFVGFKEAVSKQCLIVCKEVDQLKEIFKTFEFENQPKLKDLPVFLDSEKFTIERMDIKAGLIV